MELGNLTIERPSLRSEIIRQINGEREFEDISTIAISTGVNFKTLTRFKWINWALGKGLESLGNTYTGMLQFAFSQSGKALNFNVMETYENIYKESIDTWNGIVGQLGQILGSTGGWMASIGLAGKAAIKFPVLGARVGLALAEEGAETFRQQLGSFLENVFEATLDTLGMAVFSGYRKIGELINLSLGGAPIDWASRQPWSIAKGYEQTLDSIDNDTVKQFVNGFSDGFIDSILDIAYVVSFTIDDHYLATQAAVDIGSGNLEPIRTLEVFPDQDNENESVILEDTQNNVELALNNYLANHQLINNRDVGTVVGQTYDEWYTLRPQSRKLVLEFRGKETPPFLNPDGSLAQRVQIAIPNAKQGISWQDLKQIKRFTWGNYLARGVFEDRRQISVWGGSEAEAKDTLLKLAELSEGNLIQVSVSHPEIQNIARRKQPTVVYPSFATLLVRKSTVGANDYTLIDGQNRSMARDRIQIWKENPPTNFTGF